MITAIAYRIQCDNRDQCVNRRHEGASIGYFVGDSKVIDATSGGSARDVAKANGWRRQKGALGMVDVCPACVEAGVRS